MRLSTEKEFKTQYQTCSMDYSMVLIVVEMFEWYLKYLYTQCTSFIHQMALHN